MDTEIDLLYHFHMSQSIILFIFELFKNRNNFLSWWTTPKQTAVDLGLRQASFVPSDDGPLAPGPCHRGGGRSANFFL